MKAYVALTVANEIDGRNTVVRADFASKVQANVENWIRNRPATWREQIRLGPPPQQGLNLGLQPQGAIMDCLCQLNVIEIELEDN